VAVIRTRPTAGVTTENAIQQSGEVVHQTSAIPGEDAEIPVTALTEEGRYWLTASGPLRSEAVAGPMAITRTSTPRDRWILNPTQQTSAELTLPAKFSPAPKENLTIRTINTTLPEWSQSSREGLLRLPVPTPAGSRLQVPGLLPGDYIFLVESPNGANAVAEAVELSSTHKGNLSVPLRDIGEKPPAP
jgi:hypothetical protein